MSVNLQYLAFHSAFPGFALAEPILFFTATITGFTLTSHSNNTVNVSVASNDLRDLQYQYEYQLSGLDSRFYMANGDYVSQYDGSLNKTYSSSPALTVFTTFNQTSTAQIMPVIFTSFSAGSLVIPTITLSVYSHFF